MDAKTSSESGDCKLGRKLDELGSGPCVGVELAVCLDFDLPLDVSITDAEGFPLEFDVVVVGETGGGVGPGDGIMLCEMCEVVNSGECRPVDVVHVET